MESKMKNAPIRWFNKVFSTKFQEGYVVRRETPEEGRVVGTAAETFGVKQTREACSFERQSI